MLDPFHAPTCKAADATVSIIQSQFSCSWATCYGSVVTDAAAAGCLTCLMAKWPDVWLTNAGQNVQRAKRLQDGSIFNITALSLQEPREKTISLAQMLLLMVLLFFC